MKITPMTVELIDSMGSDLSVVNAARVSFAKESTWEDIEDSVPFGNVYEKKEGTSLKTLTDRDQKLIAYLAKHNHWTPFAHAFLSYRIKAPIFVARQLVKHQVGLAWNEVSRRYVDEEPEAWMPKMWRKRSESAKQGSLNERVDDDLEIDFGVRDLMCDLLNVYQGLLSSNVAPEQARMILPLNTMTEWIWSGSLAAFARVCKLRLDPHAQAETQEIAQKINDLVPREFEHSWKALMEKKE